MKECVQVLHDLQLSRRAAALVAIREKYKQHKVCVTLYTFLISYMVFAVNIRLKIYDVIVTVQMRLGIVISIRDTRFLFWRCQRIIVVGHKNAAKIKNGRDALITWWIVRSVPSVEIARGLAQLGYLMVWLLSKAAYSEWCAC